MENFVYLCNLIKNLVMELTKNIVALQKNLVSTPDNGDDNLDLVYTTNAHLMTMGYMLDRYAIEMMARSRREHIIRFHNEAMTYLKEVLGGDNDYKPIYKNFPQEVMNKTDIELFAGAIVHYMSNGTWEPPTVPFEKEMAFETVKYTVLKYATQDRFNKIFTDLVSVNTSLMPQDMEIIKWFVSSNQILIFPDAIPFKENLCTLAGMGLDVPVKTTTDVLRIAVHMSGGDISLPKVPPSKIKGFIPRSRYAYSTGYVDNPHREAFKFKKFTRSERKRILSLLEKTNCDASEMILKSERWVRLGEILHPGEYKTKYPKAFEAFTKVRESNVKSWYSRLNAEFKISLSNGLLVLEERPGEFVRRIDWLVRTYPDNLDTIMTALSVAADKASNKILFEVYEHFEKRKDSTSTRKIMIKGARKPYILPELPEIPRKTIDDIQTKIMDMLISKFSKLEPLGVCIVDEKLKKIPIPTNMRNMDFTTKPIIRGQRTPIELDNPKVIRGFVHWFDEHGNEDLDLSATFVGVNNEQDVMEVCSYMRTRLGDGDVHGVLHSGDVRHRQGACAEYIDIDIEFAKSKGFKYAVFDVRNFNGGSLDGLQAVFGTMEREFPESNNIWLPETISRTQKLQSKAISTYICIIDLETMEYIHLDIDSEENTAMGSIKETKNLIELYSKGPKFSVYDLVLLHVIARGTLANGTEDENIPTTNFKAEDFMYSYEKVAQLLGI